MASTTCTYCYGASSAGCPVCMPSMWISRLEVAEQRFYADMDEDFEDLMRALAEGGDPIPYEKAGLGLK